MAEHQFDSMGHMGTEPATLTEVKQLLASARDVCGRLDPNVVGLHEVPEVFDDLVALQRVAGGAVTRMTARYEESNAWRCNGSKSPEDDVAKKTGTSTGQARKKLRTSKRLTKQPKTDEALRSGELSDEQAEQVSSGADAAPEAEDELLASAKRDSLPELRRKAERARARADRDREERRRRLHRQRAVRRWRGDDGMDNLLLRLPPDAMAEVDAALKRPIDERFAEARRSGAYERHEQYAADVVKDLLTRQAGPSSGSDGGRSCGTVGNQAVRPDKKVIALIDLEALNRGHVEGDETCEIAGVGPVSVSAVRSMMSDAFLALVIKDGIDVLHVTHFGRQATAAQRTAMEARGPRCEVCGGRYLLDIDHNEGWTFTKDTRLEDLSWLCNHCHDLKTRHHLRLVGAPGAKRFVTRSGKPWNGPADSEPPPRGSRCRAGADPPGDCTADGPTADGPDQGDLFTLAD